MLKICYMKAGPIILQYIVKDRMVGGGWIEGVGGGGDR